MTDVLIRKRYRKNGGVMYEYRFEIANVDGQRKWHTKCGFQTDAEARKAGREAQSQYENFGQVVNKEQISYSDFLDYWIDNDCKVDLKPITVVKYIKMAENLLKPRLGAYRLKSLTRETLQAFLIEMYDKGYSYNSLTVIKGLLTKSLNYAEDYRYIAYSPARRLKIPKNRIPKVPTRSAPHQFIPQDIMQKVFERFPERTSQYIPLKLGYECGLRIGEAFALCWEDIDFKNKVIKINRQIQWFQDNERTDEEKVSNNGSAECGDGYWYFSAPKYNSYRMIEISDELVEILLREKERQCKARDYYGTYYTDYTADKELSFSGKAPEYPCGVNRIGINGDGFPIHPICIRENGTLITTRTMQHTSKCIRKEIFPGFDFHSLRHTHTSMLAEIGVDQKYIQTRLGHADIKMTIGVYEHTTDIMRERGRKALNYLYR